MSEETKETKEVVDLKDLTLPDPSFRNVKLSEVLFPEEDHKIADKSAASFRSNVRNQKTNYQWESNKEDKKLITAIRKAGGIITPPIMEEIDVEGVIKLMPLQGTRRWGAIKEVATDHDEKDKDIRESDKQLAKTLNTVKCVVYKLGTLTEAQRWFLIADHTFYKSLTLIEQYYTACRFFGFGWGVDAITEKISGSKGDTNFFKHLFEIGKLQSGEAQDLYFHVLSGLEAAKPKKVVGDNVLRAFLNSVKEGKCTLKDENYNDLDPEEIVEKVTNPEAFQDEPKDRLRPMTQIKAAIDLAAASGDKASVIALEWVLSRNEALTAEPATK